MKKLIINRKKMNLIFMLVVALLISTLSIGYSALSQNLHIAGDVMYRFRVWAENLSYDNTNTGVACGTAQCMIDCIADQSLCPVASFHVGDYFTMVPDSNSYTISTSMTGYTSNQTINPSELTLWRIININQDGSIDAISDKTSSTMVYFRGVTGYKNYVNSLQTIASQYAKTGFTKSTRMMGYDGQTLTISNTSAFDGTNNTEPSANTTPSPTQGSGLEYSGGSYGDTLYLKDYQLVNRVGFVTANKVGTTSNVRYYIASRHYYIERGEDFWEFGPKYIDLNGILGYNYIRVYDGGTWFDYSNSGYLRPIITLKSNIGIAGGAGTSSNPYTLTSGQSQGIIRYFFSNGVTYSIGETLTSGSETYNNFHSNVFMKYIVDNNIIISQNICFLDNNNLTCLNPNDNNDALLTSVLGSPVGTNPKSYTNNNTSIEIEVYQDGHYEALDWDNMKYCEVTSTTAFCVDG